jgi:DNA polymerase III subunit epsilon
MKEILTCRALAWDLESTGTDVHNDRIVSACAAITEAGRVVFERRWLFNPGVPIPAEATEVHGITDEQVQADGIDPERGVKEIANAIRYAVHSNMPVVAFNGAFDASMLNAECVRYGLGTLEDFCGRELGPVVDPHVIDRAVDRFRRGSRKLGDTCTNYDVVLEDAHTAAADAVAAGRVAYRLAQRATMPAEQLRAIYADPAIRDRYGYKHNPGAIAAAFEELGKCDLRALHDRQVAWYREQADGLGDYWAKKRHTVQLLVGQLADRIAETDDPAVRDDLDEQRAAADVEVADLDAKLASLSTEWPIRALPAAVTS